MAEERDSLPEVTSSSRIIFKFFDLPPDYLVHEVAGAVGHAECQGQSPVQQASQE